MTARDNPFASCRVEGLSPRLHGSSWPELLDRFQTLGQRAAIVGPHGSGKTTLLEAFAQHWQRRGGRPRLLRLNAENRRLPRDLSMALLNSTPQDPPSLVLLDGAEQLSWWRWRCFLARVPRETALLITTHLPGRLPTLHACTPSPTLLADLIADLLPDPSVISKGEATVLFQRHDGDIRNALRELYDRWAELPDARTNASDARPTPIATGRPASQIPAPPVPAAADSLP